jgi:glycosyltransferase involved in cell wall biosynthesis
VVGERRLRVVFSLDSLGVGGTEMNAVRTAERLDPDRYDLAFVCLSTPEGPLAARLAAAGVPVHPFPISSLHGWRTMRQGVRLARFLRATRTDVFHAHDIYSNVFGLPFARLAGVPRVVGSRRWWEGPDRAGQRLANRVACRFAHAVLANSERVGALVAGEGISPGRIAIVPNFVDDDAFAAPPPERLRAWRAELGIGEGEPVVGIVANLHPVKDHASLLRAAAILRARWPALRVVVVGGGDPAPLQALAATLGVGEAVRFAGARPAVPSPHHLFDVSVLCSRSEGLPNSILEAMAAGRPVVATRVGAIPDAVVHGVTGLLVPPGDPAALADAIGALLDDAPLRRRMGAEGRRAARARYAPGAALAALAALYGLPERAPRPAGAAAAPAPALAAGAGR